MTPRCPWCLKPLSIWINLAGYHPRCWYQATDHETQENRA